jgi:hypothetical protein
VGTAQRLGQETAALTDSICDAVLKELRNRIAFHAPEGINLRALIAMRVIAGIAGGERDPYQLRRLALVGIDG